jgi:hypothetical protein
VTSGVTGKGSVVVARRRALVGTVAITVAAGDDIAAGTNDTILPPMPIKKVDNAKVAIIGTAGGGGRASASRALQRACRADKSRFSAPQAPKTGSVPAT